MNLLLLFLLACCCSLVQQTSAFGPSHPTARCVQRSTSTTPFSSRSLPIFAKDDSIGGTKDNKNSNNDDDDTEEDYDDFSAPVSNSPKSQMTDYITMFLDKTAAEAEGDGGGDDDDQAGADLAAIIADAALEDISEATHLIAIPLDSSHELLIELESVQRAILHHCPILLDACISGTMTRLPLLYVRAPDANINDNPRNSASVTATLARTLRRLVKKHIYEAGAVDVAVDVAAAVAGNGGGNDDKNESENENAFNEEGYRPLTMTFRSLEIDGGNNNILNTVGTFCDRRFNNLMNDLQSAIAAQGWKMAFLPDPNRADYVDDDGVSESPSFRPRVPFMELPKGFDENISRFKNNEVEITDENMKFLRAEEGGNGISPIFWSNWWEDVFVRNLRLQEIGIYPTNPMLDEEGDDPSLKVRSEQFYVPYETIALPGGTDEMIQSEKKFLDYHEERMKEKEAETARERAKDSTRAKDDDYMEDWMRQKIMQAKTKSSGTGEDTPMTAESKETALSKDSVESPETDEASDTDPASTQKENDYIETWMEDKIKNAVNNLESVKSRQYVKKEPKYSIEDNPVFKAYRDGSLSKVKTEAPAAKELGPYPGNDHFNGFWKVLVNPMGGEDNTRSEDGSENLILRVDGTTAAGPTLNPDTRQKSAGGTWKMLPQENGDVLLRIRLVIPPEKNRILVMEGRVVRGSPVGMKLASNSFGIPQVEERAKEAGANDENKLTCSGEAWIEDAVTKKNRIRAENFYIEKISGGKDPDSYTITIPKTLRRLD
eukprot:jgi/Psemu1/206323/e_gw1.405.39.1